MDIDCFTEMQQHVAEVQRLACFEEGSPMSLQENPLIRELTFYEAHKSEWLTDHESQFVVVSEDRVAGFFDDYASAWDSGTKMFGLQANFLIKQICQHEPVYFLY